MVTRLRYSTRDNAIPTQTALIGSGSSRRHQISFIGRKWGLFETVTRWERVIYFDLFVLI